MSRMIEIGSKSYFLYAGPHSTRERAQAVLEDCYADGDVDECEDPRVVSHKGRYWVAVKMYEREE